MDSIGYGRFGGSAFDPTPNVMIDLAKASQGQRDALALQQAAQQNDLLRFKMEAEQNALSRDASFRALAPGVMQGSPDAFQSATGIDPERAAKLRAAYELFGDDQRKRALQNLELMGQGAASLLALPADQAAAQYPSMLERLKAAGIDTSSLPAAYPGPAALEQFSRMVVPVQQTLARQDGKVRPLGESLTDKIIRYESGGNPGAVNPLSGAAGLGQFMPNTWAEFVAAHPQKFQGMTPDQIQKAAFNPVIAREAIEWYNGVNRQRLSGMGVDPTDPNVALAYKYGAQGAQRILQAHAADPNTPMSAVVSAAAIEKNPELARATVGSVISATQSRFASRPVGRADGIPITQDGRRLVERPDGTAGWEVDPVSMEVAAQRQASKPHEPKPLPSADRKELVETGGRLSTFDNLAGTFDDKFGGYGGAFIGDIDNWIKRNIGGDQKGAEWWSTYQALKNVVRNDQFGAALTATEKAEFEKAAVNPGMRPDVIRNYLARQQSILQGALDRRAKSLAADGYRSDAIEEAMGRKIGAGAPAPQAPEMTAINPRTGQKLRLNTRTNQWEPM
jgi:hypothetical protein